MAIHIEPSFGALYESTLRVAITILKEPPRTAVATHAEGQWSGKLAAYHELADALLSTSTASLSAPVV